MPTKQKLYPDNNIIRELRESRNLSIRDLADKLNISRSSVWELEKGYTRMNQEYLQIYADFFNVSYDYLLGKQKNELVNKGFSKEQVAILLSDQKVIQDLQVKAYVILSMIMKEEDIKVVIAVMMDMLKESDIDVKEELQKRYTALKDQLALSTKNEQRQSIDNSN